MSLLVLFGLGILIGFCVAVLVLGPGQSQPVLPDSVDCVRNRVVVRLVNLLLNAFATRRYRVLLRALYAAGKERLDEWATTGSPPAGDGSTSG